MRARTAVLGSSPAPSPTHPIATIWNGSHGPRPADEQAAGEHADRAEQEAELGTEAVAGDQHHDEHRAESGHEARAAAAPPSPRRARRAARPPSVPARRARARRTAPPPGRPGASSRISGASRAMVLVHAGRERQDERPDERERAEEVDPDRGPRCAPRVRPGAAAMRAGAGRRADRGGRERGDAHASAPATCSGVSHPGPNARVICGANTCESPSTGGRIAVGDDLAAGQHHHARRHRRGQLDVVRGEDHGAAPRGVRAQEPRPVAPSSRGRAPRVGSSSSRTGAPAAARRGHRDEQSLSRREVAGMRRARPAIPSVGEQSLRPRGVESPRPQRDPDLVGDRVGEQDGLGLLRDRARRRSPAAAACPRTRTVPRRGAWTPATDRSSVVFPAPFRPITATISPGAHARGRRRGARRRRRASP